MSAPTRDLIDGKLINEIGDMLFDAAMTRIPIVPFSESHPAINLSVAYQIQRYMIARRVELGERVVGKKIYMTFESLMSASCAYQPYFGMLTDTMLYPDGAVIPLDSLIQPRARGEIAFLLKREVKGPAVTAKDILNATAGVVICFEILDSRVKDLQVQIEDIVADNSLAGAFVVGTKFIEPHKVDFANCSMSLTQNGLVVSTGGGDATLSNPAEAVAWLANALAEFEDSLKAGEVILSGSPGSMVAVHCGDELCVSIEGLGQCTVSFA